MLHESGIGMKTLYYTELTTPVGELTLVADETHLLAVTWENEKRNIVDTEALVFMPSHSLLEEACKQLMQYFGGLRRVFDLPLNPTGTHFQRAAWKELCGIAYGETISYAEQAKRLGNPKAMRAVGAANGRNPISIIIPCHRVIGKDGSLTGFAAGLDVKHHLLYLEQHTMERMAA